MSRTWSAIPLRTVGVAAAACLIAPSGAGAVVTTPQPSSLFTDSVGINLHLNAVNGAYDTNQATVQSALQRARIRHVRSFFRAPDPAKDLKANPNLDLSGDRATNSLALLGRAGVRGILVPGPTLPKLYANSTSRVEDQANDGWGSNFTGRNTTVRNAQDWLIAKTPYKLRIGGLEGVNEPNLKYENELCLAWVAKSADYQQRLIAAQAGTSVGRLSPTGAVQVPQVAPAMQNRSGNLCSGDALDPWRALGRNTSVAPGSGFTTPWNAGWTQPTSLTPAEPWFTAGSGSVASQIDVGNLHAYPGREPAQWPTTAAYYANQSTGAPLCTSPVAPGDTQGGGWRSCSAHVARTTASGATKPTYMTETGYALANGISVPEKARGVYIPRLLLENFQAGIKRTYLYELLAGTAGGFQLLPNTGPTATSDGYLALDRLQWAIGDGDLPGDTTNGPDFADPLDLTVTPLNPDANGTVKSQLFQEKSGNWSLAVWPTDRVVATNGAWQQPTARTVRIQFPTPRGLFQFTTNPASTASKTLGTFLTSGTTSYDLTLTDGYAQIIRII